MTAQPEGAAHARPLFRLFVKLAVRGPVAQWPTVQEAPQSAFRLIANAILFASYGLTAFWFWNRSNEGLVIYLHAITLALLFLYLFSAAGDLLGDRSEIQAMAALPVSDSSWYRAKVLVLGALSAPVAGALNLGGLVVGTWGRNGRAVFIPAHGASVALEWIFCLSAVLLIRRLGRGRKRRFLSRAGILAAAGYAVALVVAFRTHPPDSASRLTSEGITGCLLPPAWFAALDAALMGVVPARPLALCAIAATACLAGLAVAVPAAPLAFSDEGGAGLGTAAGLSRIVRFPWGKLMKAAAWGLSPSSRAAFALTTRYLLRSREVQKRFIVGLAEFYLMPLLLLLPGKGRGVFGPFSIAFTGMFLSLYTYLAVVYVDVSRDWEAARVYRWVPLAGPAELRHGAWRAIVLLCVLPTAIVYAGIVLVLYRSPSALLLLLPGALPLPLFALLAHRTGRGIPFASPPDGTIAPNGDRPEGRWLCMAVIAGIATLAYRKPVFWWFLAAEAGTVAWLWLKYRSRLSFLPWHRS